MTPFWSLPLPPGLAPAPPSRTPPPASVAGFVSLPPGCSRGPSHCNTGLTGRLLYDPLHPPVPCSPLCSPPCTKGRSHLPMPTVAPVLPAESRTRQQGQGFGGPHAGTSGFTSAADTKLLPPVPEEDGVHTRASSLLPPGSPRYPEATVPGEHCHLLQAQPLCLCPLDTVLVARCAPPHHPHTPGARWEGTQPAPRGPLGPETQNQFIRPPEAVSSPPGAEAWVSPQAGRGLSW